MQLHLARGPSLTPTDTFSGDFVASSASHEFDNGGPSLLSDMEAHQLDSFFSHANPFGPATDAPAFSFPSDALDQLDEYSGWNAVPPATIHNISTTIPDQALLHGFHPDQQPPYTPAQQPNNHFASTAADLQAASTLYAQAQIPHAYQPNGRSHSFHGVATAGLHGNGYEPSGLPSATMPLVPTSATPNGLMHEQLAALLPNHDVPGSIDASVTTQFGNGAVRIPHEAELQQRARPSLKRAYTYGTDTSFNESGFQPSSKQESEEVITKRLMRELHHAQPLTRTVPDTTKGGLVTPTGHTRLPPPAADSESNDEGASNDSSADEDEEKRQRKRRKRPPPATNGKRKSVSGPLAGKARKASADDRVKKPRRKSTGTQRPLRENLTEEQKRNNHILSEQKRRNLIKRGFDDLHDLVPAIRDGGLSKSGVLTEAANFLELLIADNERYSALLAGAD